MRRTSILAAAAALCLGACSKPAPSSGPPDGAALFREQNCIQCHGPDGAGTNLGPALRQKQTFWTREKLAAYIANAPAALERDARLRAEAGIYLIQMTAYAQLSLEQRLALADYVLRFP